MLIPQPTDQVFPCCQRLSLLWLLLVLLDCTCWTTLTTSSPTSVNSKQAQCKSVVRWMAATNAMSCSHNLPACLACATAACKLSLIAWPSAGAKQKTTACFGNSTGVNVSHSKNTVLQYSPQAHAEDLCALQELQEALHAALRCFDTLGAGKEAAAAQATIALTRMAGKQTPLVHPPQHTYIHPQHCAMTSQNVQSCQLLALDMHAVLRHIEQALYSSFV